MQEELATEKQKDARKRKQLFLGGALVAMGCATLLFLLDIVVFAPKTTSSFDAQDVDATPPQVDRQTAESSVALQAEFVERLNEYETRIEPALRHIDLRRWDSEQYHQITDLKKQATAQFGAARYAEAVATVNDLTQRVLMVIERAENLFEKALHNAKHAYKNDQYDDAKYQIERALMLNIESSQAKKLQAKIEALPTLLSLLEQIKIANKENNHQKEYALIERALAQDANRVALVERKKTVSQILRDQTFKTAVAEAFAAIEKKQAELAKQKLATAKRMYPKRPDVAVLERQLMALEKNMRLENALESARALMSKDDWLAAQKVLEKVYQEALDDKVIVDELHRARQIVQFKMLFERYIQHSNKLLNDKVYRKVTQAVAQSEAVSAFSPSLRKQRSDMRVLLRQSVAKVPVEILSDGKTYVSVRGVGKIGSVQKKNISLQPGTYVLEGKRRGFKSKLITLTIPLEAVDSRVTVICDEPI